MGPKDSIQIVRFRFSRNDRPVPLDWLLIYPIGKFPNRPVAASASSQDERQKNQKNQQTPEATSHIVPLLLADSEPIDELGHDFGEPVENSSYDSELLGNKVQSVQGQVRICRLNPPGFALNQLRHSSGGNHSRFFSKFVFHALDDAIHK